MKRPSTWLIFIFLLSGFLQAQTEDESADSVMIEENKGQYYFFPLVYWTPQTRLAGGLVGTYVFRFSETPLTTRPSTVSSSVIYTQKKQVIFTLGFDHFWMDNRRRLTADIQYIKYPDWFWGNGNQTPDSNSERFTPQTGVLSAHYTRHVTKGLYLGAQYELDAFKITRVKPGGFLDGMGYGKRGTRITSGIGFAANWDTRNSTLFPASGSYHQTSLVPFHAATGSDYDFVRIRMDFRQYFTVFKYHVFAYQVYGQFMFGDVPFNKLAEFGSIYLMRGYYPGRYRDRQMIAGQAEYRFLLFWRFGLVLFAGAGDVAGTIPRWNTAHLKYSRGAGLRFTMNRDNHLNLRIDIAYGKNSAFPVIAIGEAF